MTVFGAGLVAGSVEGDRSLVMAQPQSSAGLVSMASPPLHSSQTVPFSCGNSWAGEFPIPPPAIGDLCRPLLVGIKPSFGLRFLSMGSHASVKPFSFMVPNALHRI